MDPISAAASLIGLVGAAAKVSECLFKFIRSVKEAPKLASTVLQEVSDISACLSQLQSFLMGTKAASRSHENLLMVEQIVVVLSNCMLIFSELEEIVESLKPMDPMQAGRRAQWILKERIIKTLFTRLQASKVSLNLMMTTLTCSSVGEAQASVSELALLVTQVLENNREMSRRMASIEEQTVGRLPSTIPSITGRGTVTSPSMIETNSTEDNESVVTIKRLISDSPNGTNGEPIHNFGFSFDQDLNTSRPYTRALNRHPVWSAASSEICTMGWSCLSGLSVAEVSQISVINLPIFPHDLWNGQRYSASQVETRSTSQVEDDCVGLILSKLHSNSSSSLTVQPAPILKRRQKIRNSIRASLSNRSLSMIEEDTCAPVATMKVSLLGMTLASSSEQVFCDSPAINYGGLIGIPLSGKTTISDHLQLLYGNGITEIERIVAFEVIAGNLIHTFREAWYIWSDQYGQETDKEHFDTLVDITTDDLSNASVARSCQRALRYLWNNEGVRDLVSGRNEPMFDRNVPYYMENLDRLFSPDQLVSDSAYLRHNRRGLGIYKHHVYIDQTEYQIHDPSARSKWIHCVDDVDVVIFVVSLIGYYRGLPEHELQNNMMSSLEEFAALTKQESLKSTPIIVLLNKFDLFEEQIPRNEIPTYSGSRDASLACRYFASEFLKLDERPNASLRIYRTSAVDQNLFKATMDSIAKWIPQHLSERSAVGVESSAPIPSQTDEGWIGDSPVTSVRLSEKEISAPIIVNTPTTNIDHYTFERLISDSGVEPFRLSGRGISVPIISSASLPLHLSTGPGVKTVELGLGENAAQRDRRIRLVREAAG